MMTRSPFFTPRARIIAAAAVHFRVKFAVGEASASVDLGGDVDQRLLAAAGGQVPVQRVVAEIGLAADEPARERRPRVVEHLREGWCQSTSFACSAQNPSRSSTERRWKSR